MDCKFCPKSFINIGKFRAHTRYHTKKNHSKKYEGKDRDIVYQFTDTLSLQARRKIEIEGRYIRKWMPFVEKNMHFIRHHSYKHPDQTIRDMYSDRLRQVGVATKETRGNDVEFISKFLETVKDFPIVQ